MSKRRIGAKNVKEVARALERLGGAVDWSRGDGSHAVVHMPGVRRPVTLQDRDYGRVRLGTICRQAEVSWGEFCDAFEKNA